ncbi:glucose-6-phosphate isomerase [Candidatus Micrarchaeota archaeon]|nr:glucose-6-phosphate isomerase [Candidatus Micrarchaeota archaeon]
MDATLYEKPLRIELKGNTLFVNGNPHPRAVRTAKDLEKTLYENKIEQDYDVYYMFRNVYTSEDLRFDITLIPAGELGLEKPKTFGHFHPKSESGKAYPEVYQVLKGDALFLLQKNLPGGRVDVVMVDAKEGDVVLIPPEYGHVSINKGEEDLVLANLVYDKFSSLYEDHGKNRGAAYYYLKDGELVQNSNYIVESNERITAEELNERYGFSCQDILAEFYREPQKFGFLENPGMLNR